MGLVHLLLLISSVICAGAGDQHEFLKFQIIDHRTGDALEVQD
ncbi:MAG TPA: hypothetical protein VMS23_10965 [Terrimicrobiaceae bacterium]|nr:hypothetical protein [Terrimicrobiaceae bacterium]